MLLAGWKAPSFTLIVTVFVASCSTMPEPFESPPHGAHSTAVFYSRWVGYLDQFDTVALQKGCRPALIEPRPGVPYRGTVVLVHAYTACPQQFFELAELLALRGYRSMLVLLPGHGRMQTGTARVREMPTGRNWRRRYATFADTVNGIMAYAGGERVIGGHSTGAAASLLINSRAPSLYDRHIAWVPYFQAAERPPSDQQGLRVEEVAAVINTCLARRSFGRAGYCGPSATDPEVPTLLGQEAFRIVTGGSGTALFQFVASEHDTVVRNDSIIAAVVNTAHVFACMYPPGVPHSMVSQFDNPGVDMYWLDSLLNGAIDFISKGRPFPTRPVRSAKEPGMVECALLTERTD